jgi:hypothetical protein
MLPLLDTHLLAKICTVGTYEAENKWNFFFTTHLKGKGKVVSVLFAMKAYWGVDL